MKLQNILFKGPFQISDIEVKINNSSNRKIHPEFENNIDSIWSAKLQEANQNITNLWDSNIYRLNSFSQNQKKLILELNLISFKTIIGLKTQILRSKPKISQDYWPKGLFVSAIIKTSDNRYIFAKTKSSVIKNGQPDIIGGVLSKEETLITDSRNITSHLLKELHEEINIKPNTINNLKLEGGIVSAWGNIGLIFSLGLTLNTQQVKTNFDQTNDGELEDIIIIEENKFYQFVSQLPNHGPALKKLFKKPF